MTAQSIGSPLLWVGFTLFVLAMLALDLGVFHRKAHRVGMKEAAVWAAIWILLALIFGAGVWALSGPRVGLEFLTGYVIEKALSVDNIFVILVILRYFAVPPELQHRVLFWGILGALVMRLGFILAGSALLTKFHWVMYLFGGILVLTAIRLLRETGAEVHPERNPIVRLFRRVVPSVGNYRGSSFLVREQGRLMATPLLLVLVTIEATDLVFAVDSIPAIFAVTRDPFIVYTSNIFAILGLRSLFFLLAGVIDKFHYLKLGLGLVLLFVGFKMILTDVVKIPIGLSLLVILLLLAGSVAASLRRSRRLRTPSPSLPES
ncbi:MAG: TerC family protein [Planctomycetaceae bacterium]